LVGKDRGPTFHRPLADEPFPSLPMPPPIRETSRGTWFHMKLLFDFFPILLFFVAYKFGGQLPLDDPWLKDNPIYIATLVAIVASVLQVGGTWVKNRKVENMHLISLVLIVVFGGATLYLKDPLFIKWKPTVLNWLFGLVFLGSQFIGRKPIIERMIGGQLELPAPVWRKLNLLWTGFFFTIGAINLYVAYSFEEQVWVNFKLFGMLGLTFLFVILQSIYLSRYLPEAKPEGE
jgi:intracellular septation protein